MILVDRKLLAGRWVSFEANDGRVARRIVVPCRPATGI